MIAAGTVPPVDEAMQRLAMLERLHVRAAPSGSTPHDIRAIVATWSSTSHADLGSSNMTGGAS